MDSLFWAVLVVLVVAALVLLYRKSSGVHVDPSARELDAQNFAKLLVAEIKFYYPHEVDSGQRNNDLYGRLKEQIDKAQQNYASHVEPEIANRTDYFHQELVKQLAEGDVSRLGDGYKSV